MTALFRSSPLGKRGRPPIAWVFSRDTACMTAPLYDPSLRKQMYIVKTAGYVIPWIRGGVWRLMMIYDPDDRGVELLGKHKTFHASEAISFMSERMGKDFLEYAVDMLFDKYEGKGGVAEVLPSTHENGVVVKERGTPAAYITRIDFSSRTVEVWYNYGRRNIPIEQAENELKAPWGAIKRIFAVGVLIKHYRLELMRKVNSTLKDGVVLHISQYDDFSYNIWDKPYEYYPIRLVVAPPLKRYLFV